MIEGFGLLCGHLAGDYLLQSDWMATNKTVSLSGKPPDGFRKWRDPMRPCRGEFSAEEIERFREHDIKTERETLGHLACAIHCLLYTASIWACSFWWMPWWGLLVCFLAHWPIDRFRLARVWMERAGQKAFATGPMSPWSVVVVDNTFHLLTLFGIALVALWR